MPAKRTRMCIHVVTNNEPHPLDAEILRLAGQLRKLVRQRGSYFISRARLDKDMSQAHRDAVSRGLLRMHAKRREAQ